MSRQGLEALDEKASKPLEGDSHRATHAAQGNPFHQQPFDERPSFIRDEVLLRALHKLARARLALMLLFAIMRTAILLEAG
jgi:hypothetical protein